MAVAEAVSAEFQANVQRVVGQLQSAKNVVVLSGAGMSTAAGIPDFRSPGGLYGSSAALLDQFTYLEQARQNPKWQRGQLESDIKAALTYRFLSVNPMPYHEMRRGLILGLGMGQWKLTLGHVFPEILNRNGKLRMLASQNIDGLDHKVVSDKSKLYNPHGLMSVLVSEGAHAPLCTDIDHPLYQRYVELVKTCTKDMYAEKCARKGKSSHLWPAPEKSTPITLEMFGDLLPEEFHKARDAEKKDLIHTVKPGSVLFDRKLWNTTAAGDRYDAFGDVGNCDMMLVMGTSLSGLTIDGMAYMAAGLGRPIAVFDMTNAPVESIKANAGWDKNKDSLLKAPLDVTILSLLDGLGWLDQALEFLPHLCLGSLRHFRAFAEDKAAAGGTPGLTEAIAKIDQAIADETERERAFYGDEA